MTEDQFWMKLAIKAGHPSWFKYEDVQSIEDGGFITLNNGDVYRLQFEQLPNGPDDFEDKIRSDMDDDLYP